MTLKGRDLEVSPFGGAGVSAEGPHLQLEFNE